MIERRESAGNVVLNSQSLHGRKLLWIALSGGWWDISSTRGRASHRAPWLPVDSTGTLQCAQMNSGSQRMCCVHLKRKRKLWNSLSCQKGFGHYWKIWSVHGYLEFCNSDTVVILSFQIHTSQSHPITPHQSSPNQTPRISLSITLTLLQHVTLLVTTQPSPWESQLSLHQASRPVITTTQP